MLTKLQLNQEAVWRAMEYNMFQTEKKEASIPVREQVDVPIYWGLHERLVRAIRIHLKLKVFAYKY